MNQNEDPEIVKQKRETVGVFSRGASTYGQVGPPFFSHFGSRLVELAQVPSGANVLDVATGRGAVLLPAAAAVGSQGHATGIDLSREMVEETAREIERLNLKNTEVRLMDAEHLEFSTKHLTLSFAHSPFFSFPNSTALYLRYIVSSRTRVVLQFQPGGNPTKDRNGSGILSNLISLLRLKKSSCLTPN